VLRGAGRHPHEERKVPSLWFGLNTEIEGCRVVSAIAQAVGGCPVRGKYEKGLKLFQVLEV